MQALDVILKREVSRKEFIVSLGVSAGVLAGIPAIMGVLTGKSLGLQGSEQNDYNVGRYGGHDGPSTQRPSKAGLSSDIRTVS